MLYEGDERNSRVSGGGSREHFIHIPDALERTRESLPTDTPSLAARSRKSHNGQASSRKSRGFPRRRQPAREPFFPEPRVKDAPYWGTGYSFLASKWSSRKHGATHHESLVFAHVWSGQCSMPSSGGETDGSGKGRIASQPSRTDSTPPALARPYTYRDPAQF